MLVWGFAPDPVGGANSTPQIHSWLQGGCFAAGGEGIEETTKGTEGREGDKRVEGWDRGVGEAVGKGRPGGIGNSALAVGG